MQTQPSLADIQKLLATHSTEAESIKSDLNKARNLLSSCDERLEKLLGQAVPAKDEPQKPQNPQKPLKWFVKDVLNKSNQPLTIKEVAALVLEAGYKTASTSENFRSIVAAALANDAEFKRKTRAKTRPIRYAV